MESDTLLIDTAVLLDECIEHMAWTSNHEEDWLYAMQARLRKGIPFTEEQTRRIHQMHARVWSRI